MIDIEGKKYYTTQEVADKFGITIQSIYKWRKSGKIKYKQAGPKTFYYLVDDIIGFIEGK